MLLRVLPAALIAILAQSAFGETLVCSYPAWASPDRPTPQEPVVVEIKIDGRVANVRWAGKFDFAQRYDVLENTQYGLVVSHTYAAPEVEGRTATIGSYTFLIDRKTGAMRYRGFFVGDQNLNSAEGMCLFQK
jgi:hypothetical protein